VSEPTATSGSTPTLRHTQRDAAVLTLVYSGVAVLWIVFSDRFVEVLQLAPHATALVGTFKGVGFVVVTAALLYGLVSQYARRLESSQRRYRDAQEEIRAKEAAIRLAYVDVLDAVTGGKLILVTPDELEEVLGRPVLQRQPLHDSSQIGEARHRIRDTLEELQAREVDATVLAASEALTNAVKHADGGEYAVLANGDVAQVVVTDFGAGIDFRTLPKATLVPGFSTKPSLGMGFTIMLDVSDRLFLSTAPGRTTVVLEVPAGKQHDPSRGERLRAGAEELVSPMT
jgi:anti-sigma regulatory factor (Ser/Thr protein kinase)